MLTPEKEILRGWKEIEAVLGMNRKAILRCGYPVRKEGDSTTSHMSVFALRSELLSHARKRRTKAKFLNCAQKTIDPKV